MSCPRCGGIHEGGSTVCDNDTAGDSRTQSRPFVSSPAAERQALTEGTMLQTDTYVTGPVLGRGSFTITYQATRLQGRQEVAIKEFIPPGCSRQHGRIVSSSATFPDMLRQFQEEATALSLIEYPSIVRVLDSFAENGTGYMVMELLRGEILETRIARLGRIGVDEAVRRVSDIAQAISEAARVGVLAHDVRPFNVMLTEDGRTVVFDFGTVRRFAAESTGVVGEPSPYVPPERDATSARGDVYAAAALLYLMLTGVTPVSADKRANGKPLTPPHLVNPLIAESLSATVMNGMSLTPEERPPTLGAFRHALADPPPVAEPAPAPPQPPPPPPKKAPPPRKGKKKGQKGASSPDSPLSELAEKLGLLPVLAIIILFVLFMTWRIYDATHPPLPPLPGQSGAPAHPSPSPGH